ncbi:MAG TPA: NAD+ synthase [Candidatus Wallbacteria bacterium]|nr:NAD+ synthase [Candidatus Wallbacteria bacterium]
MKNHDLKMLDIDCKLVIDILTRFIKNEVTKTGMSKVILGLSGGIDSSLVAFLCAEALGGKNVLGVRMPYKSSSSESLSHAEEVAKKAGIEYTTFDISATCDSFTASSLAANTIAANFLNESVRIENEKISMEKTITPTSRGNIMARARMLTLYHLSAATGAMVVGTSNKTELMLGYGTLWGDLAYGINPVGDLYKYQVRLLSKHIGVPDAVIAKKPSADLFPGQTDEGDLGFSYEELDRALYRIVDCREDPRDLAKSGEVAPELVNFCLKKITTMQYKRQMPLIAMVSFRTINQSFNYPRDWAL